MSSAIASAGKSALHNSLLYKAAVVGAGPAGLALIGTLLDQGVAPILWVDPAFNAGRLERYVEVPSNTKVKLFAQYALVSPSLAAVSAAALEPFKAMDQDKGCDLGYAQRMVAELTAAIRTEYKDKVHFHTGTVAKVEREAGGTWRLDDVARCESVFLATGAHPRPPAASASPVVAAVAATPGQPRALDLDDMLTPSRIPLKVSAEDVVGVVGSSHSAVLVLRNLLEMKGPGAPKKVVNLYRSPLKYAQFMDNWILYDNTGLKGMAADWAHEQLDTRAYEASGRLERVCVKGDPAAEAAALAQCTAVVHAVGFDANAPPAIVAEDGTPLTSVSHDVLTGCIKGAEGVRGFGIAFPEQVTDPHGNVEMSVGLWKFMRYVRKVLAPAPPAAAL